MAMYRRAALPSPDALDEAARSALRWAHLARPVALVACVLAGVATGLWALGQLQPWALVFMLAYGSVGLGAGFLAYRFAALPLLRRALDRRLASLAARHGVDRAELAWTHAYLV